MLYEVITVVAVEVHVRGVDVHSDTEVEAARSPVHLLGVDHLLFVLALLILVRITSYNVCYTKLLRLSPCPRLRLSAGRQLIAVETIRRAPPDTVVQELRTGDNRNNFV